MPDRGSEWAAEGTAAHALCAKLLKQALGEGTGAEDAQLLKLRGLVTPEMEEHCRGYAELVLGLWRDARASRGDASLEVERKLGLEEWIPEGFGTADALICADGLITVIDFKYGAGVAVEAAGNPQLRIYALGAIAAHRRLVGRGDTVRMAIFQPRRGGFSDDEATVGELLDWGERRVKPKAAEAWEGGAQAAGDWCRFCGAKGQCAECMRLAMSVDFAADPELMTEDDYAAALPKLGAVKAWCEAAEKRALELMMAGARISGFKLVAGRGKRVVTDALALAQRLRAEGFDDADIFKEPEPQLCGITELERIVGRKRLERLAEGLIQKKEGAPAIAPESDRRKAIETDFGRVAADFDGFGA